MRTILRSKSFFACFALLLGLSLFYKCSDAQANTPAQNRLMAQRGADITGLVRGLHLPDPDGEGDCIYDEFADGTACLTCGNADGSTSFHCGSR